MFIFGIILLISASFVGGFTTRQLMLNIQNRVAAQWYHLIPFVGSSVIAAAGVGLLLLGGQ